MALTLALGLAGAAASAATTASDEPDPAPQVDLPSHSDYAAARKLLTHRKWEEAALVLRSVLKRNPGFTAGAIDLAQALAYLGRREEGVTLLAHTAALERGVRRERIVARERVLSRMFLTQKTFQIFQDGLNLLDARKHHAARERFEKALEVEPDNVEILTRLGQTLVLDGELDAATERLRLAERLDPHEPEIHLWLGHALQLRGGANFPAALEELQAAQAALPGSERAPIWYAEALSAAGHRKTGYQILEDDVEERPFHLESLLTLAKLRSDNPREPADSLWSARKTLQAALSRLPQYPVPDGPSRSEGELGIELRRPATELKTEITAMLAQLDSRLHEAPKKSDR